MSTITFDENSSSYVSEFDIDMLQDLMKDLVVKLAYTAERYETEESLKSYSHYKSALSKVDSLKDYDISIEDILSIIPDIDRNVAYRVLRAENGLNTYLSEVQKERLLNNKRKEVIDNYEEKNEYYRMLMGLPPLTMDPSEWVYYGDTPIHLLTQFELFELRLNGELKIIQNKYITLEDNRYWYIRYVDKFISTVTLHEAQEFEVVYFSKSEYDVKFREMYNKEREVWMLTYHSAILCKEVGLGFVSYHEAHEVTQLKSQALVYFILNYVTSRLDKTSFTEPEAIDIWKEYNLDYPKGMPSRYRNPITFILSYLVMYKGTNHVMEYLCNTVFSGVSLYKYFITKNLKDGISFPIAPGTPNVDIYDVKYIKTKFSATDPYSKNEYNTYETNEFNLEFTYDEMAALDPKWSDSEELKEYIYGEDFSYVNSKYLSLNGLIYLNKFSINFFTMSRAMIEASVPFKNKILYYNPTTGYHNWFSLWNHLLCLTYFALTRHSEPSPDTLDNNNWYKGINIPSNFDEMRAKWTMLFYQTDFRDFLVDFPDALNDNDVFAELIYKIDNQIRSAEMFDFILASCKNIQEWNMAHDYYMQIRRVKNSPSSYGETPNSTGKSLEVLLEQEDALLYAHYQLVVSSTATGDALFKYEYETLVATLIDAMDEISAVYDPIYCKDTLEQAQTFTCGISSYIMYVLNMFKAYTADFIVGTDTLIYDSDMVKMIDWNYRSGEYRFYIPEEVSHYDYVSMNRRKNFRDLQFTKDEIFAVTPYGDFKISFE